MRKLLLFLIMMILFISCSNNNIQKNFSLKEKEELSVFIETIKENLSINNTKYIKENTKKSLKNEYVLENIDNISFSDFSIFISKPIFKENKNIGNSILGLNLNEETIYLKLYFIYDFHSKKWFIDNLEEIKK